MTAPAPSGGPSPLRVGGIALLGVAIVAAIIGLATLATSGFAESQPDGGPARRPLEPRHAGCPAARAAPDGRRRCAGPVRRAACRGHGRPGPRSR